MSYPYLPVNSCCTDVVINDPCGCSSTITNGSCNDNPCGTNVTLSSTIVYNGPALTCTTAEPCDTLNVILQKIDNIICNLLSQISTLNTQVTNINNQLVTINSNITDINDTLDVCCVTTTSTSSSSTTTTTTTIFACTTYSWASVGDNISDLEYFDCDNISVKIDRVDVTDNSGFICVYPGTTPVWNPTPSTGYHDISTTGITCVKP